MDMDKDRYIKLLDTTPQTARIGGWGVVFGGNDLVGDTFTPQTDFKQEWYTHPPVLYDHTMNLPQHELGKVVKMEHHDYGLWIEAELDRAKEYTEAVLALIEQGALGFSTGSASHLVRMKGSTIAQWPILEVSLTTTPCEPRTVGVKMNESEGKNMSEEKETYEAHEAHDSGTDSVSEEMSSGGVSRSWMDNQLLDRISQMEQKFTTLMDVMTSQAAPSSKMRPFVPGDVRTEDKKVDPMKAWDRYLRTGDRGALKAAMEEGTPSEGGYLVPEGYSNELIAALKDMSILRRAGARVITVTGTDSFNVPTLSHSTAAVKTSEEGAYSEVEPTVGEVTFVPMKLTKLVKVSEELLMDSRIDLMRQVLMPDFEQAFAAAENSYFTTGSGSGSSEPQGITVGASDSGVTTSTASTISADNIIDTYHALGYLYRQNAVWLMNDTTIKAIRKLKESTTGNYLWQPGLTAGQPDTIMGRPVYTLNTMPELGTASNKVIIFGDLAYYWIVDFGSESVRRLDELYSGNGQVGFRAYRRIGGNVMLDDAIVYAAAGS
jgi:HK97 family phage major capsid protein